MTDIEALCRAVDQGDDSALAILADAMEEAGDGRSEGLRRIVSGQFEPGRHNGGTFYWRRQRSPDEVWEFLPRPHILDCEVFDRLDRSAGGWVGYETRREAYLALAAAMQPNAV